MKRILENGGTKKPNERPSKQVATNREWITYPILCYTCVNCLYCSKLKEPKTYHGSTIACVILALASILFFVLAGVFKAQAQCLGDDCSDPQTLVAPSFDGVSCAETVCNGDFPNYSCTIESDGEPDTCWSQEYDYFVQIEVVTPGFYYFHLASDYVAPPTAPVEVIGGIQMAIYNTASCTPGMNPLYITTCAGEDGDQQQSYVFNLYLNAGTYIIQIDGFGGSYGCSLLCIYGQFFLNLGVEEFDPIRNQMNRHGFDVLGRRVW